MCTPLVFPPFENRPFDFAQGKIIFLQGERAAKKRLSFVELILLLEYDAEIVEAQNEIGLGAARTLFAQCERLAEALRGGWKVVLLME